MLLFLPQRLGVVAPVLHLDEKGHKAAGDPSAPLAA